MQWPVLQKSRLHIMSGCALIGLACFSVSFNSCLAQSTSDASQRPSSALLPTITSTIDAWCASAVNLPFPSKPVYGRVFNQPFKIDRAYLTYDTIFGAKGSKPKRSLVLTLRQGAMVPDKLSNAPRIAFDVTFFNGDLAGLVGKTIIVSPSSSIDVTKNYPMVTVATNVVARQGSQTYTHRHSLASDP